MVKYQVPKRVVKKNLRTTMKSKYFMQDKKKKLFPMIRCPFDAAHMVDPSYIERHIVNCASKENLFNCKESLVKEELGTVSLREFNDCTVPELENWDEECYETYNPVESTKDRIILRSLIGASKSMKKRFKLAERERIQMLENMQENRSNVADSTDWDGDKMLTKCVKDIIHEIIVRMNVLQIQDVKPEITEKVKLLNAQNVDLVLMLNNLFINSSDRDTNDIRNSVDLIENIFCQKLRAMLLCSPRKQNFSAVEEKETYIFK